MSSQSFADLWIWEREGVADRLRWYHDVSLNQMPAKYLICSRIPAEVDLASSSEEELWKEHSRLSERFLATWRDIRKRRLKLSELPEASVSLTNLSVELVKRMLTHCNFCRWNCSVDRAKGGRHGTCQLDSSSRVGSYFHHQGEEIVFRGNRGSGTVFFTSCNMRCGFCQNGDISRDKDNGIPVSPESLAMMAWQLRMEGCHNINWVGGEPTIHLHTIVEAISLLRGLRPNPEAIRYISSVKDDLIGYRFMPEDALFAGEFNAPQLWNSNFFMGPETLRILRCLIDVWLPDFKFGPRKCAVNLSRTPWYWETASLNHRRVYEWGEDIVIRHLIMPNHVECCTKPVLDWIAKNMPDVPLNLMDQFHPDSFCDPYSSKYDPRYGEISRFPSKEEIMESYRYAKELGLNFEPLSYEKSVYGLRS